MIELTAEQIKQYYHRSYTAVDGLWFMKVEEKYGFNAALDVDNDVWQVMPKIQARWLKSVAGKGEGIESLLHCFTTKLSLDGHVFSVHRDDDGRGFHVEIQQCPWFQLMVKSGREHLAGKMGIRVCTAECSTWASEFGKKIRFSLDGLICHGSTQCILSFHE